MTIGSKSNDGANLRDSKKFKVSQPPRREDTTEYDFHDVRKAKVGWALRQPKRGLLTVRQFHSPVLVSESAAV